MLWSADRDFKAFAEASRRSSADLPPGALASFLRIAGIGFGEEAQRRARRLLLAFLREYKNEQLRGHEQGPLLAEQLTTIETIVRAGPKGGTEQSLFPLDAGQAVEERYLALTSGAEKWTTEAARLKGVAEAGNVNAALEGWQRLRRDMEVSSANSPSLLRARVANNIGGCLLDLGKLAEAEEWFRAALAIEPSDARFRTNLALAQVLQEKYDDAAVTIQALVGLQATQPSVRAMQVRLASARGDQATVSALDSEDEAAREVLVALGIAHANAGRLADAERRLRRAIELAPDAGEAFVVLARVLNEQVRRVGAEHPSQIFRLEPAEQRILTEVRSLADSAITAFGQRAQRIALARQVQADSFALEGKFTDACQYYLLAHNADPSDAEVLANLFTAAAASRNDSAMETALAGLRRMGVSPDDPIAGAFYHLRRHDPAAARSVLIEQLGTAASDEDIGRAVAMFLQCEYVADAAKLLDDFKVRERRSAWSTVARVEVARASNDRDGVVALLMEEASQLQPDEVTLAHIQLARRAAEVRLHAVVLRLYGDPAALGDEDLGAYVFSSIASGKLSTPYKLAAERRRARGAPSSWVTPQEAQLLWSVGDVAGARDLFGWLASAFPSEPDHALNVALCAVGLGGASDDIRRMLEIAGHVRTPGRIKAHVAAAAVRAGRPEEGLRLAYDAARADRDDEEVQRTYVEVVHMAKGAEATLQAPETIAPSSAVCIQRHGRDPEWVQLLPQGAKPLLDAEWSSSGRTAKLLLGRKVGDSVDLSPDQHADVVRIAELRSCFVHLATTISETFRKRFPDEAGLREFHIQQAQEVLTTLLTAQEALWQEYRTGRRGIGWVAEQLGRSVFLVAAGASAAGDIRILAGDGTPASVQAASAALRSGTAPLVLDATALAWFALNDRLELLAGLGRPVIVARATVDDVRLFRDAGRFQIGPTGSFLLVDGEVRSVMEPEDAQQARERLAERTLRFIDEQCEVRPASQLLEWPDAASAGIASRCGRVQRATIAVAAECQGVVVTHDLVTAKLARAAADLTSLTAQAVCIELRRGGQLTGSEYSSLLADCVRRKFWFTPIDAESIWQTLVSDHDAISDDARTLIAGLVAEGSRAVTVAAIVISIVRRVWLTADTEARKLEVLTTMLDLVGPTLREKGAAGELRAQAALQFQLVPLHLDEVDKVLLRWERSGTIEPPD